MKNIVKAKLNIIKYPLILVGFLLFAGIGVFGLAGSVRAADYYAEGVVMSADLLSGVSDEAWITGFTATSSVPASTTAQIIFSNDGVNYYFFTGTA